MRSRIPLTLALLSLTLWTAPPASAADEATLRAAAVLPIQHRGQVKSFESFARQTLRLVAERSSFDKRPATLYVLDLISRPTGILDKRWIRLDLEELRAALELERGRSYYTYEEIAPAADKLVEYVRSAKAKRDADQRPSLLEQKAETLYTRMVTVRDLADGTSLRLMPDEKGAEWLSLTSLSNDDRERLARMLVAHREGRVADFVKLAGEWRNHVLSRTADTVRRKTDLEALYHRLEPFHGSWVAYLVAFAAFSILPPLRAVRWVGAAVLVAAFVLHTAGLVLRVLILSRPPVSNMYESIVFMNWVLMLSALIYALVRRQTAMLSVGALMSALVMIYGDLLPMDRSLDVLVPVLRSNYWLTIHVMTIVSSYGVYGLAMGLGHRHLILERLGRMNDARSRETSAASIFRTIQVGTLLLGIGTVLGGVWANESWGRFWGWDPKETWALITFLGYLVIIHLKTFRHMGPRALAVSSILGFLLVLMTWYGVNFVLGRGLHSYGHGSGGASWIVYYLIAEALFLTWAIGLRRRSG
ncbi:MAG: Cytochrome c biogenesis protein CcsA [Candidatus Omnitrophica bacterium]|nr:Cytochrome c biogenesis protein CcsA [Candidatus Omnitrophota bacterium]